MVPSGNGFQKHQQVDCREHHKNPVLNIYYILCYPSLGIQFKADKMLTKYCKPCKKQYFFFFLIILIQYISNRPWPEYYLINEKRKYTVKLPVFYIPFSVLQFSSVALIPNSLYFLPHILFRVQCRKEVLENWINGKLEAAKTKKNFLKTICETKYKKII